MFDFLLSVEHEPVPALPRNSNGKILKHELRRRWL